MNWKCTIAVLLCAGAARAAEPVRLDALITEALARNPEILAAQKRYEAARQRPSQEGSLPEPVVSVGYQSTGGPLPGQGLGAQVTSNIGIMLSQEIPYPGKRLLRTEIAQREAGAEFQDYEQTQLSVRSRATQAFHRLHHAWAELAILSQTRDLMTQMLRVGELRYSVGKSTQPEILRAQTQLSLLETEVATMEQDKRTAEAEINSLLNRAPGNAVGEPVEADLPSLRLTLDQVLSMAAKSAPMLMRDQRMIERSELAVDLAKKDFHPDYTVAAGYYNMGAMPPMYQVRVDIPVRLYGGKRQQAAVTEQVDRLAESRHTYAAAQQDLQFRVREAWTEMETAQRLVQLYTDTVLPQSDLTVESSLIAFENGTGDMAAVLANLTMRQDAAEKVHQAELSELLAMARIEELTGVSLTKGEGR